MTAAVLDAARVLRANAAVANVLATPIASAASVGQGVHHKAARIAATVPVATGSAAGAVHATSATRANTASHLRLCQRLALLCFRTTKALNRSRARFE
jgi:hypothetical protein